MDKQSKLDVQLALACLMFLPESMRTSCVAATIAEAMRDPDLARELLERPRLVFEQRCGHLIPANANIQVHLSTADSIHLVLPLSSAAAQPAQTNVEITDEDLLSEVLTPSDLDFTAVSRRPPRVGYVKPRK